MALKNKRLGIKNRKLKGDNESEGLQKDPIELSNLIFSFQNALAASDRKTAKEILNKIDNTINDQFKFERNILYPRIRGLTSKMIKEFGEEQRMIDGFIDEAIYLVRKGRVSKARLFALSKIIPIVTSHLRDCSDMIMLCDKFEKNRSKQA